MPQATGLESERKRSAAMALQPSEDASVGSTKRKSQELLLLRVVNLAGQQLLEATLEAPEQARVVKGRLQRETGLPRFRQKLLGPDGPLDDEALISAPADLQMIKLQYTQADHKTTAEMIAAARSSNTFRLEQLLSRPLDPNCIKTFPTTTPLQAATKANRTENMKLLLEARVNANTDEDHGLLLQAAQRQQEGTVELLIAARCHLETRNRNGTTALAAAARKSSTAIVRKLLNARADMEAPNANRRRPLALAAWGGHTTNVMMLLQARCNPLLAEPGNPDAMPTSTAKLLFQRALGNAGRRNMQEALADQQLWRRNQANKEAAKLTPTAQTDREHSSSAPTPAISIAHAVQ
ncbi:caiap [Symbiodinium sp. CCMP2592]|nr:caiap [Symbiodinium sp. CCMP2592]CAE7406787.1 caiap [Symbiodinium sp. CCMP2592]